MSTRHAFDSLCLRRGRLFGWGWLLSEAGPARRVVLELRSPDGQCVALRCQQAGTRPDLAEAYPEVPNAIGAGFLVQGRFPEGMAIEEAALVASFPDGRDVRLPLPGFPEAFLTERVAGRVRGRWVLARDLAARGAWRQLLGRVWSMAGRLWIGYSRRLRARGARFESSRSPVLVFDHAMGGGANHFRRQRVAAWVAEGREVLLVTPHLPTLSYELARHDGDGERVTRFPDIEACLAALPPGVEVVVNSLVSFDDPLAVLRWIGANRGRAPSTFFLHDYHPACPVWTLVDDEGRYCGIPAEERCRQCLRANDADFLALMPGLDIAEWRGAWGRFLLDADHIVAFSKASVLVLLKAFPALPEGKLRVEPHDTGYIQPDPVEPDLRMPLTVGVVGHINRYKGAGVVAEMARLVEHRGLPVRIVVIGTIDNVPPSPVLRITGPYRSEALPELLRREGVGICLLPSICHETFSYVTAELMAHRMPLAVFDLGAPAERVGRYALGRIIPEVSAAAALDTLLAFREALSVRIGDADPAAPAGPR